MNQIADVTNTAFAGATENLDIGPKANLANWQGRQVSVKRDASSMVADAAEEMTFAMSESVEKKLNKRDVGHRQGMRTHALEGVEFYINQLHDPQAEERIRSFVRDTAQENLSPQDWLARSGQHFEDPSHQYLALLLAAEQNGDLSAKAAAHTLMQEQGPAIRAGLNNGVAVADYKQQGLAEGKDLRDFYRETILGYEGFQETWQHIEQRFAHKDLATAIAFLIKAVGNDLQSRGPSISRVALKQIVDDLYQLQVFAGAHTQIKDLFTKMHDRYGVRHQLSPREFMGKLLGLFNERWLQSTHVDTLLKPLNLKEITNRIYFLQALSRLLRELPEKLFESLERREKVLDVVTENLEEAIDREEELL